MWKRGRIHITPISVNIRVGTEEEREEGNISYRHGVPDSNRRPLQARGKVVRGQQLNGLFNAITTITQYATEGGTYGLDRGIY